MFPEAGGEVALAVASPVEALLQEAVGNQAGLGKAVHSSTDLNVHISIKGDHVGQSILVHDVVGEIAQFEPHVFVALHGGVEVEILDVDGHELCTGGGNDTVQEELDHHEVHGWGATFTGVVDPVSANSEAGLVWAGFSGQ